MRRALLALAIAAVPGGLVFTGAGTAIKVLRDARDPSHDFSSDAVR